MQISQSSLHLTSQAYSESKVSVEESLLVGQVKTGNSFSRENLVNGVSLEHTGQSRQLNMNTYSQLAAQRSANPRASQPAISTEAAAPTVEEPELSSEDRLKIDLIQRIYQRLTGKEMQFSVTVYQAGQVTNPSPGATTSAPQESDNTLESGMLYRYHEHRETTEQVQFQASGEIHTTDGKTIRLNLELNMQRDLSETINFELRAGAALKDPLVVNFNGASAELEADTYSFDLDYDGDLETLHRLNNQSGYLALDRNNNGRVDDGSELFGVRSGNGFADLAGYDEDQNGFIDEADSIWQQLRIWTQLEGGDSRLEALADHDIGALYLGFSATPWQLSAGGNSNQLTGAISSSGIYLRESGETGTLQQVDLVV